MMAGRTALEAERSSLMVEAVVNIDVIDINTGEVYEILKNVWLGDVKKICSKYDVVKIDRNGDSRTIWVNA